MKVSEKEKSESWESIKQRYSDTFVLLPNPEYNPRLHLKRGVFVYRNKNKKDFNFIVDTGASLNIIDEAVATVLGFDIKRLKIENLIAMNGKTSD
ncbi:MAG: retropepsin-like domain-containing protein [Candidatus Symbiothrix sp.]|jgi:hypothetical protein|nr:retropepsin-like domain-containing protein [Candidatus Symbiothrix sp.]